MLLSIVVPVYKAQNTLLELVERLLASKPSAFSDIEIVLVDDKSPDDSWLLINQIARKVPQVKGILLSRNFGQHHAITAGLDNCNGDWIVVMDCDLQDQPEEIPKLFEVTQNGFDLVLAKRHQRQDSFIKKLQSRLFYQFYSYLSGVKQDASIANFGIYNRKCIDVFNQMREPMRAFPPMMKWIGFKSCAIDVIHNDRKDGKSTYTFSKLLKLALDISIAYSDKPLRMSIGLGLLMSLGAFGFSLYLLYRYTTGHIIVEGYTSLMVSIWFLSGLVLLFLGISGLYISRIFDASKNRPLYIIDKTT